MGISKPYAPEFEGSEYVEGYEDVPIDADNFEGQSVLILGKQNFIPAPLASFFINLCPFLSLRYSFFDQNKWSYWALILLAVFKISFISCPSYG